MCTFGLRTIRCLDECLFAYTELGPPNPSVSETAPSGVPGPPPDSSSILTLTYTHGPFLPRSGFSSRSEYERGPGPQRRCQPNRAETAYAQKSATPSNFSPPDSIGTTAFPIERTLLCALLFPTILLLFTASCARLALCRMPPKAYVYAARPKGTLSVDRCFESRSFDCWSNDKRGFSPAGRYDLDSDGEQPRDRPVEIMADAARGERAG